MEFMEELRTRITEDKNEVYQLETSLLEKIARLVEVEIKQKEHLESELEGSGLIGKLEEVEESLNKGSEIKNYLSELESSLLGFLGTQTKKNISLELAKLNKSARLEISNANYRAAKNYISKCEQLCQSSSGNWTAEIASIHSTIGQLYKELGNYQESKNFLLKAKEIQERILPENHPELGLTYVSLSGTLLRTEEFEYAQKMLLKAKKFQSYPELAFTETLIGKVHYLEGRLRESEDLLLKTKETLEGTKCTAYLIENYYNLGKLYKKIGKYIEAENFALKARELQEQHFHPSHPKLGFILNLLGMIYQGLGKLDLSKEMSLKSKQVRKLGLPKDHPDIAYSLNSLGVIHRLFKDENKAEKLLLRAKEIREKHFEWNNLALAESFHSLGALYKARTEYELSLEMFERAKEIQESKLTPEHPDLGFTYSTLGSFYKRIGNLDKAESYQIEAKRIQEACFPPSSSFLCFTYRNLGMIYKAKKNLEEAEKFLLKSFRVQKKLPENPGELCIAYRNLGLLYKDKGNWDMALGMLLKAAKFAEGQDLAFILKSLGLVQKALRQFSDAEESLLKCLELFKETTELSKNELTFIFKTLGMVCCSLEKDLEQVLTEKGLIDIYKNLGSPLKMQRPKKSRMMFNKFRR